MHHVDEWFFQWLEFHQMLHPNRQWMRGDQPNAFEFYTGWIESFERIGATLDVAQRASRNLQENPPKFLNEHLPAIKNAIGELKRVEATVAATGGMDRPSPEQVEAAMRSNDCPECQGTGWARRQAHWPSHSWTPMLDMFCRCPHGRWRKANDPDLATGRNYDDLQAWPSIWDSSLNSPLWSNKPVTAESIADPDTENQWYYLPPSEAAPGAGGFRPLTATFGAQQVA